MYIYTIISKGKNILEKDIFQAKTQGQIHFRLFCEYKRIQISTENKVYIHNFFISLLAILASREHILFLVYEKERKKQQKIEEMKNHKKYVNIDVCYSLTDRLANQASYILGTRRIGISSYK